jgi:hypothetical protein
MPVYGFSQSALRHPRDMQQDAGRIKLGTPSAFQYVIGSSIQVQNLLSARTQLPGTIGKREEELWQRGWRVSPVDSNRCLTR